MKISNKTDSNSDLFITEDDGGVAYIIFGVDEEGYLRSYVAPLAGRTPVITPTKKPVKFNDIKFLSIWAIGRVGDIQWDGNKATVTYKSKRFILEKNKPSIGMLDITIEPSPTKRDTDL